MVEFLFWIGLFSVVAGAFEINLGLGLIAMGLIGLGLSLCLFMAEQK